MRFRDTPIGVVSLMKIESNSAFQIIRAIILILTVAYGALPLAQAQQSATQSGQRADAVVLDRFTVAVLPTVTLTNDPAHSELADDLIKEILDQLAAVDGVHVVDPELIRSYADSSLSPVEIGRELGAATVVESSIRPAARGYTTKIQVFDAVTAKLKSSSAAMSYRPSINDSAFERMHEWVSTAVRSIEHGIYPDRMPDRAIQSAIARVTFLDTTRTVAERIEALRELRPPTMSGYPPRYIDGGAALSGEVAATAAQLATQSHDPNVKVFIWKTLTGVNDQNLVQPLIYSLTHDSQARVRAAAAAALAAYSDQPVVRDALEAAENGDPNVDVQQAAYYAMLSIESLRREFSKIVLDSSLPEAERRTALFRLVQINRDYPIPLDQDLVETIADFATTSKDAQTRRSAWFMLVQLGGSEAVSHLIDALTEEPSEVVRERIVSLLSKSLDEPDVLDAIKYAHSNDTSPLVRNTSERVLQGDEQ
jgi:TolB-like protein/HEAT repeat protein